MQPISRFPTNSQITVCEIQGKEMLVQRLAGIGIIKNTCIEILHADPSNSMVLVKLGSRRLGLRLSKDLQIIGKRI